MASALFSKLSPQTPAQETTQNPSAGISSLINQILGATNPQQSFNQMLQSSQDAQNAMNIINQYGNGDPKAAFLSYAQQKGQSVIAQQIMQKLGLS
jgi:hypothetical protein